MLVRVKGKKNNVKILLHFAKKVNSTTINIQYQMPLGQLHVQLDSGRHDRV